MHAVDLGSLGLATPSPQLGEVAGLRLGSQLMKSWKFTLDSKLEATGVLPHLFPISHRCPWLPSVSILNAPVSYILFNFSVVSGGRVNQILVIPY